MSDPFCYYSILLSAARYALIFYVKEHIVICYTTYKIICTCFQKCVPLQYKHKRYKVMKCITLRKSTYQRIKRRMRYAGDLAPFEHLIESVSFDSEFVYLYFASNDYLSDATLYLFSYNVCYVVNV